MFAKFSDRKGVSMIEYALLAGLIALALIAAVNRLSGGIGGAYNEISTELESID